MHLYFFFKINSCFQINVVYDCNLFLIFQVEPLLNVASICVLTFLFLNRSALIACEKRKFLTYKIIYIYIYYSYKL